jgi:hypothetical protein
MARRSAFLRLLRRTLTPTGFGMNIPPEMRRIIVPPMTTKQAHPREEMFR